MLVSQPLAGGQLEVEWTRTGMGCGVESLNSEIAPFTFANLYLEHSKVSSYLPNLPTAPGAHILAANSRGPSEATCFAQATAPTFDSRIYLSCSRSENLFVWMDVWMIEHPIGCQVLWLLLSLSDIDLNATIATRTLFCQVDCLHLSGWFTEFAGERRKERERACIYSPLCLFRKTFLESR